MLTWPGLGKSGLVTGVAGHAGKVSSSVNQTAQALIVNAHVFICFSSPKILTHFGVLNTAFV
jgi:hypothetical protein